LAGLDHAQGNAIISMDGDHQHPPQYIPSMIKHWEEGFEIVNMIKENSGDRGALNSILGAGFYWIFNKMSSVKIQPNGSDYRLIDRKVHKVVQQYRLKQFFLRGIIAELGFKSINLSYEVANRRHGVAKYTLGKLFNLALRGFFSYSDWPLKIPFFLGMSLVSASMVEIAYGIVKIAHGEPVIQGWLSIVFLVTAFGAIFLLLLGIQGIYLSKIYDEVRNKPLYSVRLIEGLPPEET